MKKEESVDPYINERIIERLIEFKDTEYVYEDKDALTLFSKHPFGVCDACFGKDFTHYHVYVNSLDKQIYLCRECNNKYLKLIQT